MKSEHASLYKRQQLDGVDLDKLLEEIAEAAAAENYYSYYDSSDYGSSDYGSSYYSYSFSTTLKLGWCFMVLISSSSMF